MNERWRMLQEEDWPDYAVEAADYLLKAVEEVGAGSAQIGGRDHADVPLTTIAISSDSQKNVKYGVYVDHSTGSVLWATHDDKPDQFDEK